MAQKRGAVGQEVGSDSYKWMELKQNQLCRPEEEDSFQDFMVATGALLELIITEKQEQQQQKKTNCIFLPFFIQKVFTVWQEDTQPIIDVQLSLYRGNPHLTVSTSAQEKGQTWFIVFISEMKPTAWRSPILPDTETQEKFL